MPPIFKYDEEIADEICERVSDGETLRYVCKFDDVGFERERGTFPKPNTVYAWTRPSSPTYNADFTIRFAEAQICQQRMWVEETIDIANTPMMGEETTEEEAEADHPEKGASSRSVTRTVKKEMLGHRALQIDTRLKAVKMLNPDLWDNKQKKAEDDQREIIVHGGLF